MNRRIRLGIHAMLIVGLLMVLGIVTATPVSAADGDGPKDTDYVKYYYDSNNKYRTGYKKIILDPFTFNDVTNNTKQDMDMAFLMKLTKDKLLGQWVPLADNIFATQDKAANYIGNGGYKEHFQSTEADDTGTDEDENATEEILVDKGGGYFNLRALMSDPKAQTGGKWTSGAGFKCSGLRTAASLKEVRTGMANDIVEGCNAYHATADKILNDSPLGKRLSLLDIDNKDDQGNVTPQQIIYTTATRVKQSGLKTSRTNYYESFGIVFYDFKVNTIIDDRVEYVYPDEEFEDEDDPIAAAINAGKEGVSGNNEKQTQSMYAENNSPVANSVALSYTNTNGVETTSSHEENFTITGGQEFNFQYSTGDAIEQAFAKVQWGFRISLEEAKSWINGTSQAIKKEISQSINTTVDLPAQTAAEIEQQTERSEIQMTFNAPVAISYKVAIFSLGGHNYSNATAFYQGSRDHSDYCAVFGVDSAEGGTFANQNLYNRVVKNIGMQNYDQNYGSTHGRFRNPGGTDYTYLEVYWNKMNDAEKKEAADVSKDVPLCPNGVNTNTIGTKYTSSVKNIIPIYPLHKVSLAKDVSDEYEMQIGDKFPLTSIDLVGKNKNDIDFYGFDENDGHWVTCDEKGNTTTSQLVSITPFTDKVGGGVLTALQPGTQYLKWVVNDDKEYTSLSETQGHNNASGDEEENTDENKKFETAYIRINISERPFLGTVSLKGDYTGYVGTEPRLLSEGGLTATVEDETGKEVSRPLFWEAKQLNGITVDEDGKVKFLQPGSYQVRAYIKTVQGMKYSPWKEIQGLAAKKLDKLTISDETNPKTLATFILGDGSDEVDLSKLRLKAVDQYGNNWLLDAGDVKWLVNGEELSGSTLKVTKAGNYKISLKSGSVVSNELELEVKEKRKLKSLKIASDITDKGLGVGTGYEYDLKDVTITAKDQYDGDVKLTGKNLEWTSDGKYSLINDGKLVGNVKGQGTLRLTIDGVESNELQFEVVYKPYVNSFSGTDGNELYEGDAMSLDDISLFARDQNGDSYNMSEKEIKSIEWVVTDEGSIHNGVTLDPVGRTLKVAEGSMEAGKPGTVVLEGTFKNPGNSEVKGRAEIKVRQHPILKTLTLKQTDENQAVKAGESAFCMEFFTVEGKDQYGDAYDLKNKDLEFHSDNSAAYVINNQADKSMSTIAAVNAGASAKITVSSFNSLNAEVVSNELELTVPKARILTSIKINNAPQMMKFDSSVKTADLGAVCYDENNEAYTPRDLAVYGKTIVFSLDKGDTDAYINSDNEIVTGQKGGYITVYATAEDTVTGNILNDAGGVPITGTAKIFVGPMVQNVKPAKELMNAEAGSNSVILTGKALYDGIDVIIKDESGNIVTEAKTSGNSVKQTANIRLERNTGDDQVKYSVSYLVGSEVIDPDPAVNITVDFHKIVRVPYKAATCVKAGCKEHYKCSKCGTLFSDESGNKVITASKLTIKATGHKWDGGQMSAAPKPSANGTYIYTCKNNKNHKKKVNIPVLLANAEAGNGNFSLSWTRVSQANGYEIYMSECDSKDSEANCRLKKRISGNTNLDYTVKGLKSKKPYKICVKAYKTVNGNRVCIAKSYLFHSVCGNTTGKYTNPSRMKLKKTAVTLKKGKTFTIKGTTMTMARTKLKPLNHEPKLRYATSNKAIAKVSAKGKITAVKKGNCKIYVIAVNGLRRGITVTVK